MTVFLIDTRDNISSFIPVKYSMYLIAVVKWILHSYYGLYRTYSPE